jgi:hypothetical protein
VDDNVQGSNQGWEKKLGPKGKGIFLPSFTNVFVFFFAFLSVLFNHMYQKFQLL